MSIATANILTWNDSVEVLTGQPSSRPLVEKILSFDEYQTRYLKYLKAFSSEESNLFSYARFINLFDSVQALYGPLMENDTRDGSTMRLSNEEWYFNNKLRSVETQLARLGY